MRADTHPSGQYQPPHLNKFQHLVRFGVEVETGSGGGTKVQGEEEELRGGLTPAPHPVLVPSAPPLPCPGDVPCHLLDTLVSSSPTPSLILSFFKVLPPPGSLP